MRSILKQIYNGDLYLSERTTACISEFRTARNIAAQAHDALEDKLCQAMTREFNEYLSKESDITAYPTESLWQGKENIPTWSSFRRKRQTAQ